MSVTVAQLTRWLDRAYPPALAEDWDRVGLVVGDPLAEVTTVLLTVDVTDEVIDQAIRLGARLVVAHHPLLLRGIHAVRRDQPKGRLVLALAEAGIALFAAHTNADAATNGVSDALASALGLREVQPLIPQPGALLDKLVTFVPPDQESRVRDALAEAGAGAIGDYDQCSFTTSGTGRFRPLPGADPFIGRVGDLEEVTESRVEMVLPRGRRAAVIRALLAVHPYETPAFDVIELAALDSSQGLGRVGWLDEPGTARTVAAHLARVLPATVTGVRVGGDPNRPVRTVALLAGAGDSLLDAARASGADLFVTSDLRHHPAREFLDHAGAPGLIDIPHWAAEWLWLPRLRELLAGQAGPHGDTLKVEVCELRTDPWSLRL